MPNTEIIPIYNCRSQAQLIDDLLDVSRIVTGKLRLDIRSVDPTSIIDAAIDAVSPAAEAKGVRTQKVMDIGRQLVDKSFRIVHHTQPSETKLSKKLK